MIQTKRNKSIDYFRAFLMILVVWHHATLSYSTSGSGVLITDNNTFIGFDLIALYNDMFFMFAFFFISGLFTYKSLLKKGSRLFIEERLIRLLLPFAFATLLINPIAHYFGILKDNGDPSSIGGYFQFLFNHFGKTEANHLWFLWVLFLFSLILVIFYQIQKSFDIRIGWNQEKQFASAGYFTIIMIVIGLFVYSLMGNIGNGDFVTLVKPFNMQVSRILLYFLYFVAGNMIGMYGIRRSFLFKEKFQKKWWLWLTLSLTFTVLNIIIHVIEEGMGNGIFKDFISLIDQGMVVVISLLGLFGFMSLFTLKIKEDNKVMNMLANAAMGIYVIHYAIVTTLQYAFSFVELPGLVKGLSITLMTLILSLALVTLLNKVPVVGTVFGKSPSGKYRKTYIGWTVGIILLLLFL
jgi:surface polysaccharide O-acyltransferase-like enzyme